MTTTTTTATATSTTTTTTTTPKIRPLNDELQKVANEQLNENPKNLDSDIEAFKTWIKQQSHLRARTDDQFLLAFLRGCKHSLERAKSKIDQFYTFRTKYPEMFGCYDVDAPAFREALRQGVAFFLPTPLNENGERLFMFRFGKYNPERSTGEEIIRVLHVMQEITMLEDDYAIINGIKGVMDVSGASTSQLLHMTPNMMRRMSTFGEQALPFRPQGAYFINVFSAFEILFNMMRSMLSEKQKNRIFFYNQNLAEFYEKVPQQYLPKEYGGNNGSVDDIIAHWERKIDEYRDYFKANAAFGVDEGTRNDDKAITSIDNELGIVGSFRKLNVD